MPEQPPESLQGEPFLENSAKFVGFVRYFDELLSLAKAGELIILADSASDIDSLPEVLATYERLAKGINDIPVDRAAATEANQILGQDYDLFGLRIALSTRIDMLKRQIAEAQEYQSTKRAHVRYKLSVLRECIVTTSGKGELKGSQQVIEYVGAVAKACGGKLKQHAWALDKDNPSGSSEWVIMDVVFDNRTAK